MINNHELHELQVVDSLRGIAELAEATYGNDIPGFQVDEKLVMRRGTVAVIERLEAGSSRALDNVIPFTNAPELYNEPGIYAPHVDGGFRGLAIHNNIGGTGFTQLAHFTDDRQAGRKGHILLQPGDGHYRCYQGGDLTTKDEVGAVHQGMLVPGRLTVFSQGNIEAVKPTVHYFKRDHGDPGQWVRYTSSTRDEELGAGELDDRIEQLRLQVSKEEYTQFTSYVSKGAMNERKLARHPGKDVVIYVGRSPLADPLVGETFRYRRTEQIEHSRVGRVRAALGRITGTWQ